MADLQKLHDEALRAVTLARQAYDRAMGAYRCAPKGGDEQGRMADLLHALSDVVNVTQGTLYCATQAMKDSDGVAPPVPTQPLYIQRDHLQKAMRAPFMCRVTTEPAPDRVQIAIIDGVKVAAPTPAPQPFAWFTKSGFYGHRDEIPASDLPPLGNPVPLYMHPSGVQPPGEAEQPTAWMQIGVGPLHEGERIPRLTKPKEWNPEWWRFEPLYAHPSGVAPSPAPEPDAWIQRDHLEKAKRAPFMCRVEPTQRLPDFVPIYTNDVEDKL